MRAATPPQPSPKRYPPLPTFEALRASHSAGALSRRPPTAGADGRLEPRAVVGRGNLLWRKPGSAFDGRSEV
eukprot:6759318-Prymnesium_polylepis.1